MEDFIYLTKGGKDVKLKLNKNNYKPLNKVNYGKYPFRNSGTEF